MKPKATRKDKCV